MNAAAGGRAGRLAALAGHKGRAWAVVAAIWLPLLWRLRPAWGSIEQAHGWAVPLLALMLADERNRRESAVAASVPVGAGTRRLAWSAVLAAFVVLPVALAVLTANPLWPAAQWLAFGAAAAATLGWRALDGGGPAVRCATFPVLFVSTALTWPTFIALRASTGLGALNARLAASVVSAIGFPAVVHGNVIEVASGLVGVDEACSGVRSLPAVWMAAWFFGELLRLRWWRRLALVAAGLVVAVIVNLIRTSALTWLAAARGVAAVGRWHDTAGLLELAGTLLAVIGLARWFARGRAAEKDAAGSGAIVAAGRANPAVWVVLGLAIVGAVLPIAWFRWREPAAGGPGRGWALRRLPEWKPEVVPAAAQALLRASSAEGEGRYDGALGGRTVAFALNWDGDVGNAAVAELHDPTICLPAAGVEVDTALPGETVTIKGCAVAFTTGRFTAGGRTQHVFYCRWDREIGGVRRPQPQDLADVTRWRLERVWRGQAHGTVEFLVFLVPAADEAMARHWLQTWAPQLLERR